MTDLAAWYEKAKHTAGLFSLPGHDLDCALAMLSQARLSEERRGDNPHRISQAQAEHLLQIGWRAGWQRGEASAAERIVALAAKLQAIADTTTDPTRHGQLIDEIEGLWMAAKIADAGTWQAARDKAQAEQAGSAS